MSAILYIQASPRIGRSHSIAVADAFLETYTQKNPNDTIVTMNLFSKEMMPFDGLTIQSKYNIMHGKNHTPEQLAAWREVEKIIDEFKSADKYVMAVPMWNFLIPYRLKHYLDIIIQPGYTFEVTPEGAYRGLVTDKPVFIAFSRGGMYPEGSGFEAYDFQTKYMKTILGFIGLTDIRSVIIEHTLTESAEEARKRREEALAKAREMAEKF